MRLELLLSPRERLEPELFELELRELSSSM
jgi:hypothetical protein